MAIFHVKSSFYIAERKLFVLVGEVVDGTIRVGMLVHIRFNPSFAMVEPVHAIEMASTDKGAAVCLCIEANREEAEIWQGLNFRDEDIEVTDSPK